MFDTLVGVIVGGLLTVIGSLAVSFTIDRRERSHRQRASQLDAAKEVLGALQNLNRSMIDIGRVSPDVTTETNEAAWAHHHEAATRWNSARYAAALVCPASELVRLDDIDREVDRLLDLALSKQWKSREFRVERQGLGRLAAAYLVEVRSNAGQKPIQIETLWSWDGTERV
jgi:hypothetical protein